MFDLLYILTPLVSLPFWLMLIFRPRRPSTERLLETYAAFIILGAIYVLALVGALLGGIGRVQINASSANALGVFLSDPAVALVIWVHIWVVDLAAAYWIYYEGVKADAPSGFLRLCFLLTLVLAPVGVFTFAMWRGLKRATRDLSDKSPATGLAAR